MATTTNLGITLLEEAQAQKEVSINSAVQAIDDQFGDGANGLGDGSDGSALGFLGAKYKAVADTGTVDTEFAVAHGLGRTPVGFLVANKDQPADVYDSGTAWDGTNIYLKCSAANAALLLIIF